MLKKRMPSPTHFHRTQIGRAQRYIRLHFHDELALSRVAKEAGASPYHFARIFLAYTGETPFDFLRRIRLVTAVRMLQEDLNGSITEIALSVGYETPSAFNKVFKKNLKISPTHFRNLGKAKQSEVLYHLSKPNKKKEMEMKINMNMKPEIVTWPEVRYLYLEQTGPFAEVAPPTWEKMFPLAGPFFAQNAVSQFLGLSTIDKNKKGEAAMIYQAGVALNSEPGQIPEGLQYKIVKSGQYARFLLKGPYPHVWIAFSQIFKVLTENQIELREGFCIENYLNDPKVTPEAELLSELLVPVAP